MGQSPAMSPLTPDPLSSGAEVSIQPRIRTWAAENVDIVYTAPSGEEHVLVSDLLALAGTALIRPGSRIGDCSEGPLRAYNDAGELVAETTERLCDGDRWIMPARRPGA